MHLVSVRVGTHFPVLPALRWQDDIGPALVVRADQTPLTVRDLARFWSYCCDLLDMDWGVPSERQYIVDFLCPEAFAEIEQ